MPARHIWLKMYSAPSIVAVILSGATPALHARAVRISGYPYEILDRRKYHSPRGCFEIVHFLCS